MTNDVLGVCTFTVGGGTDIERCEMNEISTAATVVGLGMYVCMYVAVCSSDDVPRGSTFKEQCKASTRQEPAVQL